jgi:hypothetical protein
MDSGIVVQIFLGILWALGCALFVTFVLEFRDDRSAHPSYYSAGQPAAKPTTKGTTKGIGMAKVAGKTSTSSLEGKPCVREPQLYAKAGSGNAG